MASVDRPNVQSARYERLRVKNDSGSAISAGDIVYVSGTENAMLEVSASATSAPTLDTLFLARTSIPNGGIGEVVQMWHRTGVNTNGSAVGAPVYLGASGAWTLTEPTSAMATVIGAVTKVDATDGAILFDTRGVKPSMDKYIPLELDDPGDGNAIPVTRSATIGFVTAGAETNTLADPTFIGQRLVLYVDTYVGDRVVTTASACNVANNNTLTFGAASEALELVAVRVGGALVWQIGWNDGVGLTTV